MWDKMWIKIEERVMEMACLNEFVSDELVRAKL